MLFSLIVVFGGGEDDVEEAVSGDHTGVVGVEGGIGLLGSRFWG